MLKNIFLQIVLILVPFLLSAQSYGNLEKTLASLPAGTKTSVLIMDADKNKVIFEKEPELLLHPASCIKVFTTASALMYLGKDFNAKTSIYFEKEKLKNGILNGDLYIKGYGNALLNMADLERFSKEIVDCGLRKITGGIVYDNSFFKKNGAKINRADILSPLMLPSISPVSINRNIIELIISNKATGVEVKSVPSSKYITLINITSTSSNRIKIGAILEENQRGFRIKVSGNLFQSREKTISLFVKNPDLLASLLLQEKLENSGIHLNTLPRQGTLPKASFTEISSSLPLTEMIKDINTNSDNYLAETLKKIFDQSYPGRVKRENPLTSFLRSKKIDIGNLVIADGSGISNNNLITTRSLAGMLYLVYKDKSIYELFKSTLSIAGTDGTLKEQFSNSPVKNYFRGKSGYLNGVSSICGYLQSALGKNIIIAIIINYKSKEIDFYRDAEKKIIEAVFKNN